MADPAAAETVRNALDILGPDGQHWIKGQLRDGLGDYCVAGALIAGAPEYADYATARDAVKQTLKDAGMTGRAGSIDKWNNQATWPEVRSVLELTAQRLAV